MRETAYATLDEALQDIANRSFYEDALVAPTDDGYVVSDTTSHATDDWCWTYERGIEDGDSVDEHTRLMESYEVFTEARHIRHHFPDMVSRLEQGTHAVVFAYAIVTDMDAERGDDDEDIAGWIMVADAYEQDPHAVIV